MISGSTYQKYHTGLRRKTNLRDYLLLTLKETSSTAVSIIVEGALTAGVVGGKVFREGLRVELLVVGRVVGNLVLVVVDMVVEANGVVVVELVEGSWLTVVEGVVLEVVGTGLVVVIAGVVAGFSEEVGNEQLKIGHS